MIMMIIILMIYLENELIGCGEGFTYEASKDGKTKNGKRNEKTP